MNDFVLEFLAISKFIKEITMKNPAELIPNCTLQITMVGDAIGANLSSIIDRQLGTKKVILIHHPDCLEKATRLATVYKHYQIQTELVEITTIYDYEQLHKELAEIIYPYAEQDVEQVPAVNVTNGSKIMSLALHDIADALNLPIYYVNPNDTISWLRPKGLTKYALQDRIKIEYFLEAHGLELISNHTPPHQKAYRDTLDWMIQNLQRLQPAVAQLNYYAYSARNNLISQEISRVSSEFDEIIDKMISVNLVHIQHNKLHFASEEARFFANGGWLEEFIHHQIKQLTSDIPAIQDFMSSAEIINQEHKVRNEMDNLILANNHLYLIECKTKKFNHRQLPDGGAMDTIYKMDTLMQALGGPLARGMIVSIFPFNKAEERRAELYGIKLVSYEQLQNIKHHLKTWLLS